MSCPITVQTSTSPSLLLAGVKNTINLYISVETGSLPGETVRPPVDLCVVLDKSGSMSSGGKLEKSKLAISNIVDCLNARDRFALVVYDSQVSTPIGFDQFKIGAQSTQIKAAIEAVSCGSTTNLYGGLNKGIGLFDTAASVDGERTKKIFLFSDGIVNSGITSPDRICELASRIGERGVTVDSFGVGDDYAEDLMTQIGENGLGRFMHLENSDAIQQFVSYAMKGILLPVARNAVLKVRGLKGVVVQKMYGHQSLAKGALLNDLTTNNSRGVLVEAEVDVAGGSAGTEMGVVQFTLECKPLWKAAGDTDAIAIAGTVSLGVVDDDQAAAAARNADVEAMLVVQRNALLEKECSAALARGDRAAAVAVKERQVAGLVSAAAVCNLGQIHAQVATQERMLKDLKEKKVAAKALAKRSKKESYHARHDSAEYCANELSWALKQQEA